MIEAYSNGVTTDAQSAVQFYNVSLNKGCSSILQGVSSLQLNDCGVYEVDVDCVAQATTAGEIGIQLRKDGILQPQALSAETAADTTSLHALSFSTFVQVTHSNGRCCCMAPTICNIVNTSANPVTFSHISVKVKKVC